MNNFFTLFLLLFFTSPVSGSMPSETVYKIADSVGKIKVEFFEGHSTKGSALAVSNKHIITNFHVIIDMLIPGEKELSFDLNGKIFTNLKILSVSINDDLALLEVNDLDTIPNYIDILKNKKEPGIRSLSPISSFGFPQTDVLTRISGTFITSFFPDHNSNLDAIMVKGYHHGISGGPVFNNQGNFIGLNSLKNEVKNLFACTGRPVMGLIVPSKVVKRFFQDGLNYSGVENGNLYGLDVFENPPGYGSRFASAYSGFKMFSTCCFMGK